MKINHYSETAIFLLTQYIDIFYYTANFAVRVFRNTKMYVVILTKEHF